MFNIPYYPETHIAPLIENGKYRWLNDTQPPVWDDSIGMWRMWYLFNENAKFSYKTDDHFTFIDGGTSFAECLVSTDFKDIRFVTGDRLPKGLQSDGVTHFESIMSGSVVPKYNGKVMYFASVDDGKNSGCSVALWTAASLGETPVYKGIILKNTEAGHFRDPRVIIDSDGQLLMAIAASDGILFYKSKDGLSWQYLSIFAIKDMGIIECPQPLFGRETVDGATILIWCGNAYKNGGSPMTWYSTGRWDGTTFTESSRKPMDFGSDWYGAVIFADPDHKNWYATSWMNSWDYATTLPIPMWNGVIGFRRIYISGSERDIIILPIPIQDDRYYKNHIFHSKIEWIGDVTNLPIRTVPTACTMRLWIDGLLEDGESIELTHGGAHSAKLTRQGGGFIFTRAGYGVRPYFNTATWQREYFIPQPSGTYTDIYLVKDACSLEIYLGSSDNRSYNSASFLVLWPANACDIRTYFNAGHSYTGNFALWYDNYPPPKDGNFPGINMVPHAGLEPATPSLRMTCSTN